MLSPYCKVKYISYIMTNIQSFKYKLTFCLSECEAIQIIPNLANWTYIHCHQKLEGQKFLVGACFTNLGKEYLVVSENEY